MALADQILPQGATPALAPVETAAPVEDTAEAVIPDEVLQIPAIQGILEGRPAAVYDHKGSGNAVLDAIPKNVKQLSEAGINFYPSKDGALFVMFNSAFLSPEEVQQADEEGRLTEIAEPLGAVLSAYDTVLAEESGKASTEAAPSTPPVAAAPQSSSTEKKLATARLANVSLGTPTSGPAPGAGRVLNNVLKRAV